MNIHHIKTLLLASLLWLSLGVYAQGQPPQDATPVVKITVQPEQMQLHAGESGTLSVRIVVPAGHHAYLDAGKDGGYLPIDISLSAIEQAGIKVRRLSAPQGARDEQYRAAVLRGEGVFKYALTVPSAFNAGNGDYSITVGNQICNDASGSCYFPRSDTFHVRIAVSKSPAGHVDHRGALPIAPAPVTRPSPPSAAVGGGRDASSVKAPAAQVAGGTARRETAGPGAVAPTASPAVVDGKDRSSGKLPAQPVVGNGASSRATPVSADRVQAPVATNVVKDTASPVELLQYAPRTNKPSHGLLVWMLLAFIAGLLLNIMPCVLPVMSIKVLSLVQHTGESRRRAFGLGLVFAAGMLTVFLALAGAAILFGLGWGEQFQSQMFLVIMIAIVFAFALSLFGVYEFGVPHTVGSLAVHTTQEGFGSAFLKGVLATVLATPCSGPFLGSTLAWTLTQPPITVLLIFTMLGIGMALPYVILTTHPAFLKYLPKPGPWMETFKHIMGFLLLATVVYLMVSLNQQHLLLTIAFLFCVAVGGWIWGRFSVRSVTATGRATVLATALLIVMAGGYLSFHTLRAVLPAAGAENGKSMSWELFDPARLQQYHREGRSVMLDFTADWCANCKFNEIRVYNSTAVRRLLQQKHVVVMKADLTSEGPSTKTIRQLMKQLGARSIPFLAVFPGNQPAAPYTLYDLVNTNTVSNVLRTLPSSL